MSKVKILFLSANPADQVRLRLKDERQAIQQNLPPHAFDFAYESEAEPADLLNLLHGNYPLGRVQVDWLSCRLA